MTASLLKTVPWRDGDRSNPPMRAALVKQTNLTADDAIAQALSIIKGRSFGTRSTEVAFLRQWLVNNGFDIVRRAQ